MAHLAATAPGGSGVPPAEIEERGFLGPLARAQYAALARLRWRMFQNSLRTRKGSLELAARTFSYLLYGCMGLALGAGTGAAAYFLAAGDQWRFLPVLFWVLAFLWQMIPVMLASFQEQFDLGILLRFPVGFGSYLLLYLVFGLLDISTILGGLCSLGIFAGIALARPDLLLWTALDLAIFAAFNILLARAIFAWIERWLAQRKTREILGAVFMVGLLSLQVFNPALYVRRGDAHSGPRRPVEALRNAQARYAPWLRTAEIVQEWLPPGLAAQSLDDAVESQQAQGLESLGVLGLYALLAGGVLALRLKGEYRGENLNLAPARVKAGSRIGNASLSARSAGVLPLDTGEAQAQGAYGPIAAIIEKDLRALIRTLPLLWAIGGPLLMVLVFSGVFIKGGGARGTIFPFALPICMVYAQLGFTQVFYNNLGTEGAGIQLYFLSPTPFRTVMLAKNLLHSALFAVVAAFAMVMAGSRLGAPDPAILAATIAWLLFALPFNLTVGNLFSLRMPYPVNPGRISRQRGSQANGLLSLAAQLVFMAIGAVVFLLAWWLNRMQLAAPVFLLLAAGAWYAWKRVLDTVDAAAYRRRTEIMTTLMKNI